MLNDDKLSLTRADAGELTQARIELAEAIAQARAAQTQIQNLQSALAQQQPRMNVITNELEQRRKALSQMRGQLY